MKYEFWFVVGSQFLYGEEVLETVAARAKEMAEELSKALGRKVRLVEKNGGGRIELAFYGAEDREKLISQLRKL